MVLEESGDRPQRLLHTSGGSAAKPPYQRKPMIFFFFSPLMGCLSKEQESDSGSTAYDTAELDSADPTEEMPCSIDYTPYPFIHNVLSYEPGEGAGFGQDQYPDIVYGPPLGAGANAGSLDVLSLGEGGSIVFSFEDLDIIDGDGPDLIIFENPFIGWSEPGIAGASIDGETWVEWACDTETYEGCVGIHPVLSHPDNCIDARDPERAGGDPLDLADIDLDSARYIRIRDAAVSGPGGFDLEAASAIHFVEQ